MLRRTACDLAADRALARRQARHAIGFRRWWRLRTLLVVIMGLMLAGTAAVPAGFSGGTPAGAALGFSAWVVAWAAAAAALARLVWPARPFRS